MTAVDAPTPPSSPPEFATVVDERVGSDEPSARARSWLPVVVAVASFGLLCALALSHAYKLREPDPYAYRASMAALEDGHLTLSQDEYDALQTKLSGVDDGWNSGTGILQWVQTSDGRWVSEKNPGYPFLALPFDAVGLIRLAPLFYGALGCLGLWFGGRRWLGDWGGALTVGLFCSASSVLIMAYEAYMPSFTDTALAAAAGGALLWAVLAVDRSWRRRTLVGAAAFFAIGLAVLVRYTNVTILAVFAVAALVAALTRRRGLGWKVLPIWGVAAGIPLAIAGLYNKAVYGKLMSTGYSSQSVSFSWGSLTGNLHGMPKQLLVAMPVALLAAVAVLVAGVVGVLHRRSRHSAVEVAADGMVDRVAEASSGEVAPSPSRWVIPVLVGWWIADWGVYAFYDWTARTSGGIGQGPGGFGGGGGPLGGGGGSFMIATRFYLPAAGALALLAAWLVCRFPKVFGVAVLVGLFAFGGWKFHQAATGDYLYGNSNVQPGFGGGGGGPGEPGGLPGGGGQGQYGGFPNGTGGGNIPDLSKCQLPEGFQPPDGAGGGGGGGPGNSSGAPPDGATGGIPGGQLRFDDNGCPIFPGQGGSTTTPNPST